MGWMTNFNEKNPLDWLGAGIVYGVAMVVSKPIQSLLVAGALGTGGYFAYHHFADKQETPNRLECIIEKHEGNEILKCGEKKYSIEDKK